MELNKLYKFKEALDDFMENLEIDGVCGFWSSIIGEEEISKSEFEFTGSELSLYLILDRKKNNIVGRDKIRHNVKIMIKDYLNLDVYVGTIAKDCS